MTIIVPTPFLPSFLPYETHHLWIFDYYQSNGGWGYDSDHDRILDSSENGLDGIISDEKNPDTYNLGQFGGNYGAYGDEDIRCRKLELRKSIPVFPEKDWANPGCQNFNQNGPRP